MRQYSQCSICAEEKHINSLLSITNCKHKFCKNCCLQYIKARSENFSQLRCPQISCQGKIRQFQYLPQEIKSCLPEKTIRTIQSYLNYQKLQENSNLKPCSVPNCNGTINLHLKRKVCSSCGQPHCPKCMKPFHQGNCLIDKHDQEMKNADYQKCPSCSIWVEKTAGCRFIECKCGTAFCYNCGIRFEQDPCRMSQQWKSEDQIRKLLSNIKYQFPQEKSHYLLLPLKLLFQLMLFIIFTTIGSLLFLLSIILMQVALIALTPFIAFCIIFTVQGYQKFLALIFFPLIGVCLAVFFLVALIVYPYARKRYHHGIYDGIDSYINHSSLYYLKGVNKILKV